MVRRKKGVRLPRLTMLAYSAQELQRFSERCEQLSASVLALVDLVGRLQMQVEKLERRSNAAHKANATRKAAADMPAGDASVPFGVDGN
jgi:hypothetical protein